MKMSFCTKAKSALLFGLLVVIIMACGTDTPLGEYTPSSDQEAAVKNVLMDFQECVNRRDTGKVADLIHEDATLILGRERKRHSKSEYIKILPRRLADQPPIALGRPKMDVNGDTADVRIYMTRGDGRFLVTYHLRRDDHRWTISGWTY
jgi:ketosteroid isomerase-like protein